MTRPVDGYATRRKLDRRTPASSSRSCSSEPCRREQVWISPGERAAERNPAERAPWAVRVADAVRQSADRKESVHATGAHAQRPDGARVGQSSGPTPGGFSGTNEQRRPFAPKPKPGAIGAHLANGLRGLMGRSQAACRLRRTAPGVQLTEIHDRTTGDNRLSISGTATCKSPLCPLCAPALMRVRTEEITHAIDEWGAARTWFVTFTVRHNKRMPIALLHRLNTLAFGNLFGGRSGQALSRELGGPLVRTPAPPGLPDVAPGPVRYQKPHSVRAHDRTWSDRHGWHPHLHTLMFLHAELEPDRVRELLTRRWKESAAKAVSAMKEIVHRAMTEPESPDLRSRCEKTFGKRIFTKGRTLKDAARPLAKGLQSFSESAVVPLDAYGVVAELVRAPGRVAKYLSKLGLELTGMGSKTGRVVIEGGSVVEHFSLWQLAGVACTHAHPLRQKARAAWCDLFYATKGTQTLTWSQGARKAFGLDELDDDDVTQEGVMSITEEQRLLGWIDGPEWDQLKREQRHGLLASLYNAHKLGVLESLPYVQREPMSPKAFMGRGIEPAPAPERPELADLLERARARGRAPPAPHVPEERPPDFRVERWKQDHARLRLRLSLESMGLPSSTPIHRVPSGASAPLTALLLHAQRMRARLHEQSINRRQSGAVHEGNHGHESSISVG